MKTAQRKPEPARAVQTHNMERKIRFELNRAALQRRNFVRLDKNGSVF